MCIETAEKVALSKEKMPSGWYNCSINIIKPLMDKKSKVLDSIRQNKFPESQAKLKTKEGRQNFKNGIILAKTKWSNHLTKRIHDVSANPRYSWKGVSILKEWIKRRHTLPDITRFKKENGSFIETDEEVTKGLAKHFHDVFNSDIKIDWSVLDEFEQRTVFINIFSSLSYAKFSTANKKLTLHKVPGLNRI